MVAVVRLALVLLTGALIAQACTYCQCEFQNGSHCCVYYVLGEQPHSDIPADIEIGNLDCVATCANAHRADRKSTACNAGGKYECISFFTAQGRTPCYKQ